MKYITLHTGVKIPVLGLGTARVGGTSGRIRPNPRTGILGWLTQGKKADERDIAAIQRGIELGMTHIDTARAYGKGRSEMLVGRAIKNFKRRDLFLASKVEINLNYEAVIRALESSLARLDTSYLDLYLVHWPVAEIPLKETMEAFDSLVKTKKVRHIGVCNFSVEQLKEAQLYTKNKIITNQVKYNYMYQLPKKELLQYCQENNIILTAYSPLNEGNTLTNRGMQELITKYKKTAAQIALNWLISQKNVITIPKSSNIKHVEENIGALDFVMDQEERDTLSNEKSFV